MLGLMELHFLTARHFKFKDMSFLFSRPQKEEDQFYLPTPIQTKTNRKYAMIERLLCDAKAYALIFGNEAESELLKLIKSEADKIINSYEVEEKEQRDRLVASLKENLLKIKRDSK